MKGMIEQSHRNTNPLSLYISLLHAHTFGSASGFTDKIVSSVVKSDWLSVLQAGPTAAKVTEEVLMSERERDQLRGRDSNSTS